jgi:hypothetical protein
LPSDCSSGGRGSPGFDAGGAVDQPSALKRAREKAERTDAAAAKREDLDALKQAKLEDTARAAAAGKAQVAAYEAQSKQQAEAQADLRRAEREAKQVPTCAARACVQGLRARGKADRSWESRTRPRVLFFF